MVKREWSRERSPPATPLSLRGEGATGKSKSHDWAAAACVGLTDWAAVLKNSMINLLSRWCRAFVCLGAMCFCARAEVVQQDLEYRSGEAVLAGVLFRDDAQKALQPGMLVAHQWTGISAHELERARRLAQQGYVVLCVDIYGKGIRPAVPEAGKVAGSYKSNRPLLRERMLAGLNALKAQPLVDAKRLGAMGFCFGGTAVLELARSGADVRAVVSLHGGLDSPQPADGQAIKGRLLICHGAADPYVAAADIGAFFAEMAQAKVGLTFIAYPGAVHSFTQVSAGNDASKGAAYQQEADEASWKTTMEFLSKELK